MSFPKRIIEVQITLKEGFFSGDSDTITIKGHRVNCAIRSPGGMSSGDLQCVIYGLRQDLMNKLTGIGIFGRQNINNTIRINAGSEDADGKIDIATVYQGSINQSWADYSGQPVAVLQILAYGAVPLAMNTASPTSLEGDIPVPVLFESIAKEKGYTLINKGIIGSKSNPYYSGTTLDKIQAVARDVKCNYLIDEINKTLTIFPLDGYANDDIPLISPQTGLIGYPTFAENGIIVKSLFNRFITNATRCEIQSSIKAANGLFSTFDAVHNIESENNESGGAWFTDFRAFRLSDG